MWVLLAVKPGAAYVLILSSLLASYRETGLCYSCCGAFQVCSRCGLRGLQLLLKCVWFRVGSGHKCMNVCCVQEKGWGVGGRKG